MYLGCFRKTRVSEHEAEARKNKQQARLQQQLRGTAEVDGRLAGRQAEHVGEKLARCHVQAASIMSFRSPSVICAIWDAARHGRLARELLVIAVGALDKRCYTVLPPTVPRILKFASGSLWGSRPRGSRLVPDSGFGECCVIFKDPATFHSGAGVVLSIVARFHAQA